MRRGLRPYCTSQKEHRSRYREALCSPCPPGRSFSIKISRLKLHRSVPRIADAKNEVSSRTEAHHSDMPDLLQLRAAGRSVVQDDSDSICSDSQPSSILSGTSTPLTVPDISEQAAGVNQLSSLLHSLRGSPEATSAGNDDGSYILVIGGLGYIGSHTSLELLRDGYNGR